MMFYSVLTKHSRTLYLYDSVLGITFFIQTGVGVVGNMFFLCFYSVTLFKSHMSKPMDPILAQLTLANIIVLLSHGCPITILYLAKSYFPGVIVCKTVFYAQRVSRGMIISTTCLLSVFQAITISPCNIRLAKLKVRFVKFITPSCLFCWIFNMIREINVAIYITGSRDSNSSHTEGFDIIFCSWKRVFNEATVLNALQEILFVGCMVWANGYIVFLLYRHHQRIQHIRSTGFTLRKSPEIKATQTILLLVGIFFSTYFISCGFTFYKVYVIHSASWVTIVSRFIEFCFPVISPFLLIHRDTQCSCPSLFTGRDQDSILRTVLRIYK